MIVKVKTIPASTGIITTAEAKAQLHIATSFTSKDTAIAELVYAASDHIADITGRYIIEQSLECICDSWDEVAGQLPFGYFQSVTSLKYLDADGVSQTVSSSLYHVTGVDTDFGKIVFDEDFTYPDLYDYGDLITLEIVIGYPKKDAVVSPPSAEDYRAYIPNALKFACRLQVEAFYNGLDFDTAVNSLTKNYRSFRQP